MRFPILLLYRWSFPSSSSVIKFILTDYKSMGTYHCASFSVSLKWVQIRCNCVISNLGIVSEPGAINCLCTHIPGRLLIPITVSSAISPSNFSWFFGFLNLGIFSHLDIFISLLFYFWMIIPLNLGCSSRGNVLSFETKLCDALSLILIIWSSSYLWLT